MSQLAPAIETSFELRADTTARSRNVLALQDLMDALRQWRLAITLAWLDIKLRYRGSVIGPFWLTLSTAVMVMAMGVLYAELFHMELHDYMPFLALSIVLWNTLGGIVGEACVCFTSAEGMIRAMRMPYAIHGVRVTVRNGFVLAHNIVVIVGVFAFFDTWPGSIALQSLLGTVFWVADAIAICLLLGTLCARFRDIAPIVGSIMQIAFFLTPIIWRKDALGAQADWLIVNPFFCLIATVRDPLLNQHPGILTWLALCGWSAALWLVTWLLFARTRSRIAFWV